MKRIYNAPQLEVNILETMASICEASASDTPAASGLLIDYDVVGQETWGN